MGKTKISWTDETWNPVTGCSKISEGCLNCYAEGLVQNWAALRKHYPNGFDITERPERLDVNFGRKPKKIFVCDMGDLFHKDVTESYVNRVLDVIRANPQHTFQILTKRADRLHIIKDYPSNVWLGVTVENNRRLDRVEHLLRVNANIRFVSAEPLLEGFVDYSWVNKVDWVIVGGESGDHRRAFKAQWARDIMAACKKYDTAFWFKQHGNKRDRNDDLLDGIKVQEWPTEKFGLFAING